MSDRAPGSASFEPERLTPKRRRVDPVVVAAAVVVIGIGLAVLKPWSGGEDATPAPGEVAASGAIGAAATSVPTADSPGDAPATDGSGTSGSALAWPQGATAVRPHETWGVRAIVRAGPAAGGSPADPGTALVERWEPVPPAADADQSPEATAKPVLLPTADEGVLALGVTFPPDELPLDARIHAAAADGSWRWLATRPLESSPAFGANLYEPPVVNGVQLSTWPAGAYRVDVLTATGIRRIDVDIPDRFEVVPAASDTFEADGTALPGPFAPSFHALTEPIPFVVEDGTARPFTVTSAVVDAGATPAGSWAPGLPAAWAPRGNGLGVLLPDGAREASATIERLAPDPGPVDSRRGTGVRFADGRAPFVIFRSRADPVWPPGAYRIAATWTDDTGRVSVAYDLELRPGPLEADATVLDGARALASIAGRVDGAVSGMTSAGGRAFDLACDDAAAGDGSLELPRLIGIGHHTRRVPSVVTAELRFDGGRTRDQRLLVARGALPGLTVIAPADADVFAPGVYRLTLGEGRDAISRTICVGVDAPD